jgi:hypothetical protein
MRSAIDDGSERDLDLLHVLRRGPFSTALQTAIQARGLSLECLQYRLRERGVRVSLSSLSYWQRGRTRPERPASLRAVREMEAVLGLPDHALLALLLRPGHDRSGERLDIDEICPVPSAVALVEQLEYQDEAPPCLIMHDRYLVGPERDVRAIQTRAVFQAHRHGVDRHIAVYHDQRGVLADLRSATRCRFGRVRTDAASGVIAAELLFDRPLARGETYLIEYEFGFSAIGPPTDEYGRGFQDPHHEYLLEVQFDPTALPARCYRTWRPDAETPLTDAGELRLASSHTVHFVDFRVSPCYQGIRWEWD